VTIVTTTAHAYVQKDSKGKTAILIKDAMSVKAPAKNTLQEHTRVSITQPHVKVNVTGMHVLSTVTVTLARAIKNATMNHWTPFAQSRLQATGEELSAKNAQTVRVRLTTHVRQPS